MWQTRHTHDTPAAPEHVFALWADVENWPAWDASLVATSLDRPFVAGAAGTLHPRGMPEPIAFVITAVDEGAGFADETRLEQVAPVHGPTVTIDASILASRLRIAPLRKLLATP